jgi:hypothetical protein
LKKTAGPNRSANPWPLALPAIASFDAQPNQCDGNSALQRFQVTLDEHPDPAHIDDRVVMPQSIS